MTQENKELLLKDLCARLLYGVFLKIGEYSDYTLYGIVQSNVNKPLLVRCDGSDFECSIEVVKPYLHPMSSMTDEEFTELKNFTDLKYDQLELIDWNNTHKTIEFYLEEIPHYCVIKVFDWLNKHHFDYRGLIEKGLALEAPEDMYKFE